MLRKGLVYIWQCDNGFHYYLKTVSFQNLEPKSNTRGESLRSVALVIDQALDMTDTITK